MIKKEHTFLISIDDGDCKYNYPLTIENGEDVSIREIYEKLCGFYNVKPAEGTIWPSDIETNNKGDSYGE